MIDTDERALAVLADYAEGRISHAYEGICPDGIEGHDSRDPDCTVCQALIQARDYLQRRLGESGWQPIATAPTANPPGEGT